MVNPKIERAFFRLLQAGLWGRKADEENLFPLSEYQWYGLLEMARQQTVEAILFHGCAQLSDDNLPPSKIRIKCMLVMDMIERTNRKQIQSVAAQYSSFRNHGLNPVLLKGQGVANSYILPLYRMSGDIDWCFEHKEQYTKAKQLLPHMGAVPADANAGQVYFWNGAELDLHRKLFDVFNPMSQKVLKRARVSFPDTTLKLGGQDVPVLAPLLQAVQVSTHIFKHSCAFGIGLRQFCDLACLYNRYGKELDGVELRKIFKTLGLLRWISEVHQLLVEQLGLDQKKLPFPLEATASGQPILKDILDSGNFGFHNLTYAEMKEGRYFRRKQRTKQLFLRLFKYARYAPLETLWFPIMHFTAKYKT